MLEIASFLRYIDLYLTSEWGRFYVGHPVFFFPTRNTVLHLALPVRSTMYGMQCHLSANVYRCNNTKSALSVASLVNTI
jgi:hypothetical protein